MAPLSRWISCAVPLVLVLSASSRAGPAPFELTWSSQSFGLDGPWPAVEVTIGADDTVISLFPGMVWETSVIEEGYCSLNTSFDCVASRAGLYDQSEGILSQSGSQDGIQYPASASDFMLGLDVAGDAPERWIETMDFGSSPGAAPTVSNVSLFLVDDDFAAYPGGQWFPVSAGCLSLGAPNSVNQTFGGTGEPNINASLPPGTMWKNGVIPSNSFGMHIGSVSPKVPGSLWFGGYDKGRVIGKVLAIDASNDVNAFRSGAIALSDVGIEVATGYSPFNFTSKQDGLLAAGNSTIGSSIPVAIDGCSPYITLPQSTCDNLASYLPVKYNSSLGLYFWDTSTPEYYQIVTSASALTFTFLGSSNTDTLTIRVPFAHLNLVLSSPMVDSPTPYFPCYSGGLDTNVLGRAFLQDAFLGANWDQQSQKWWLAQAPGPNIDLTPASVAIEETDQTISAGGNDWATSWDGVWNTSSPAAPSPSPPSPSPPSPSPSPPSPSPPSPSPSPPSPPSPSPPPSPDTGSSGGGLSTGAIAGIAVGAVAAGLLLIGAGVFFCLRRRRRTQIPPEENSELNSETKPTLFTYGGPPGHQPSGYPQPTGYHQSTGHQPVEIDGHPRGDPQEMP